MFCTYAESITHRRRTHRRRNVYTNKGKIWSLRKTYTEQRETYQRKDIYIEENAYKDASHIQEGTHL